jgi:6,7-dimethyl-8-ribityllumazine synthase
MATVNLSDHLNHKVPDARGMKFAIVYAEWNPEVTMALKNGAIETLVKCGTLREDIIIEGVPGTFELTLGGQLMAENREVDAVILLGCVIQGETRHFDFICQGVTYGATKLNLEYGIPFIFGVLTTDNQQQALDRAGGKLGNKGDEAAYTAIRMVALSRKLEKIDE